MAEPHLFHPPPGSPSPLDDDLARALERVRRQARQRAAAGINRAGEPSLSGHRIGDHTPAQDGQIADPASSGQRRRPEASRPDATADRVAAGRRHEAPGRRKGGARPALLYALALTVIISAGAVAIRFIHDTSPEIVGFAQAQTSSPGRIPADRSASNTNATADTLITPPLMRTRGWIMPPGINALDAEADKLRTREARGLAPELFAVPRLEMDVNPVAELAALKASEADRAPAELPPPPPVVFATPGRFGGIAGPGVPAARPGIDGSGSSSRLALPPMRRPTGEVDPLAATIAPALDAAPPIPSDQTLANDTRRPQSQPVRPPATNPVAGTNNPDSTLATSTAGSTGATGQDTRNAAVASLDRTAPPNRAGARQSEQRLADLQARQCESAGFFARILCKDRVRDDYCKDRWNDHPDCARLDPARNF